MATSLSPGGRGSGYAVSRADRGWSFRRPDRTRCRFRIDSRGVHEQYGFGKTVHANMQRVVADALHQTRRKRRVASLAGVEVAALHGGDGTCCRRWARVHYVIQSVGARDFCRTAKGEGGDRSKGDAFRTVRDCLARPASSAAACVFFCVSWFSCRVSPALSHSRQSGAPPTNS